MIGDKVDTIFSGNCFKTAASYSNDTAEKEIIKPHLIPRFKEFATTIGIENERRGFCSDAAQLLEFFLRRIGEGFESFTQPFALATMDFRLARFAPCISRHIMLVIVPTVMEMKFCGE